MTINHELIINYSKNNKKKTMKGGIISKKEAKYKSNQSKQASKSHD